MRKLLLFILLLSLPLVSAATITGTIYNDNLDQESNVLVTINTSPEQKYLSKDGAYSFTVSQGTYTIVAQKSFTTIKETITVKNEGEFVYDLFLLPDFSEEEDLWKETEQHYLSEDPTEPTKESSNWWKYSLLIAIFIYAGYRFYKTRKKYGPLKKFRQEVRKDQKKTVEEHKQEIAKEPGYLENTLDIIKKHDGRISQKKLRKEMLHLSESKISLILTELEHKGKIEKIKKGRGNVIILK